VIHLPAVLDVVVESHNHLLGFVDHPAATVPPGRRARNRGAGKSPISPVS
jgi:hypothetical protein